MKKRETSTVGKDKQMYGQLEVGEIIVIKMFWRSIHFFIYTTLIDFFSIFFFHFSVLTEVASHPFREQILKYIVSVNVFQACVIITFHTITEKVRREKCSIIFLLRILANIQSSIHIEIRKRDNES